MISFQCDEVESGGQVQHDAGEERHIAFEHPTPRGFGEREQAIQAVKVHVRTEFAWIGIVGADVEIDVEAE